MDASARCCLRLVEDYWGVLLLLIAWELWVIVNQFNPIVMPTPTAVLNDLASHPGVYLQNVGVTLMVAVFGLVVGMLVGTGLAVAAWFSPIAAGLLNPLTLLFSSVAGGGADPHHRPSAGLRHLDGAGDRGDHHLLSVVRVRLVGPALAAARLGGSVPRAGRLEARRAGEGWRCLRHAQTSPSPSSSPPHTPSSPPWWRSS